MYWNSSIPNSIHTSVASWIVTLDVLKSRAYITEKRKTELNSNIRCIEIRDNAVSEAAQLRWIVTLDVLKSVVS